MPEIRTTVQPTAARRTAPPNRPPAAPAFAETNGLDRASEAAYWKNCYLASRLAEKGELEEAIVQYHQAIEIDPQRGEAVSGLVDVLMKRSTQNELRLAPRPLAQKQIQRAKSQLTTIITKYPKSVAAGEAR